MPVLHKALLLIILDAFAERRPRYFLIQIPLMQGLLWILADLLYLIVTSLSKTSKFGLSNNSTVVYKPMEAVTNLGAIFVRFIPSVRFTIELYNLGVLFLFS
jgi:hypothetical protein